jgi:hypothetical protein
MEDVTFKLLQMVYFPQNKERIATKTFISAASGFAPLSSSTATTSFWPFSTA